MINSAGFLPVPASMVKVYEFGYASGENLNKSVQVLKTANPDAKIIDCTSSDGWRFIVVLENPDLDVST